jgi:HK97 family phage prohead protease
MEKIFNLTSTFKTHAEEDGSVLIRGMASTVDFDRAGDSISAEAWQKGGMANFEKNPIILFNHDYDKPIGRATGLKAGPNGLEMEAKISKHAHCAALIKDGVLGAFSVGFRVKDADYIKETDGLMIKDAELFEVSVVSVPCNQSATFSLAKSFDSTEEYEDFKKTFTNRVDLAGQSLAKDEVITSSIASDTPKSAEQSATKEIKMSEDNSTGIDLEAFAKKVAEETAAKIAMKQAEQKAAEQAEAKAQAESAQEQASFIEAQDIRVKTGIQTGVEALMADVEVKLSEKDASMEATIGEFKKELEEKAAEIEAMRNSKKSFSDRSSQNGDINKWSEDFLAASLLGKVFNKSLDSTTFGKDLLQKAGVDYSTSAGSIDQLVQRTFEEEVKLEQQIAGLFRELAVTSGATVLPVSLDPNKASWSKAGLADNANQMSVEGGTANQYDVSETIVHAYRLIAGTFVPNDTDEQIVVSLLPMLAKNLARSHARAIDSAILFGGSAASIRIGLCGKDGTDAAAGMYGADSNLADTSAATGLTPGSLATMRSEMGIYGINPSGVAFIVGPTAYYDMIDSGGFTDVSEVGNETATKLSGVLGSVFGSRVVVSDLLSPTGVGATCAVAVATENFLRPRLGGISVETEYSAVNQRTNLIASQSTGFNRVVGNTAAAAGSVIRNKYAA